MTQSSQLQPCHLAEARDTIGTLEQRQQQQHPEELDPLQVVRTFLEFCAHHEYRQAAYLLDEHVQVSYPGVPFIKSNSAWYHQAIHRSGVLRTDGWAEAIHLGAHAGQVVRRRRSRHGALIEVFEVTNTTSHEDNGPARISAMYLRKAPSKWTRNNGRGRHRIGQRMQQRILLDEMKDKFPTRHDQIKEEYLFFRLRKGNFVF